MEPRVFLDTHILIWSFQREPEKISLKARTFSENAKRFVSPISLLEIDFLHEIGRVKVTTSKIISDLQEKFLFEIANDPFVSIIQEASALTWTRDPFDRLLVAHAQLHKAHLLTKDENIRKHYSKSVW